MCVLHLTKSFSYFELFSFLVGISLPLDEFKGILGGRRVGVGLGALEKSFILVQIRVTGRLYGHVRDDPPLICILHLDCFRCCFSLLLFFDSILRWALFYISTAIYFSYSLWSV